MPDLEIESLPLIFWVDEDQKASICTIKYHQKDLSGALTISLIVDVGQISLEDLVSVRVFNWIDEGYHSSYQDSINQRVINTNLIVCHKFKITIYSIYKEYYNNWYHTTLKKIKTLKLKIEAIDIDTCPKHKSFAVLGIIGDIMFLDFNGRFLCSQKATGNQSYQTEEVQEGERSIFAFTAIVIGTDYAFISRQSGELLVFDMASFSLTSSISFLGSYKGRIYWVGNNFVSYDLTDNTRGILKMNNSKKTARLIAQSECLLANKGITNVQNFHFYNQEKLEMSDVNQNFKFLTVNELGNVTLFSMDNFLKV